MTTHDDPYTTWDAAYLLGSLSSTERREYEEHLRSCPRCHDAVAEISGVPALLALLDRETMIRAGDAAPIDDLEPPPELLPELLATVASRRRRTRWLTGAMAAAAAVLAIGLLITLRPGPATDAPPALAMTPVGSSEFAATVTLTSQPWGTHIDMACTYHEEAWAAHRDESEAGDTLAMVAVSRDGTRARLATWIATPDATALPSGSTSLPKADIAAVQIVSADTGDVLLQRDL